MKQLINNQKVLTAYMVGATVYMQNANGKIYKQFGAATFNPDGWEEVVPMIPEAELQVKISDFLKSEADKMAARAIQKAKDEEFIRLAEEVRRQEVAEFLELINTGGTIWATIEEKLSNADLFDEQLIERKLFTSEIEALEYFETCRSKQPDESGYMYQCELLSAALPTTLLNDVDEDYHEDIEVLTDEIFDFLGRNLNTVETIQNEGESVEDDIILLWSWEKYPGYCRNFEGLRRGERGESEFDLRNNSEMSYKMNESVLLKAADVEGLTDAEILEKVMGELTDNGIEWKWNYFKDYPTESKVIRELRLDIEEETEEEVDSEEE